MIYERSDNFCLWPFSLGEEFLSESIPSRFVSRLNVCEVGLLGIEKSPQLNQVVFDGFGDGGEGFESLSL